MPDYSLVDEFREKADKLSDGSYEYDLSDGIGQAAAITSCLLAVQMEIRALAELLRVTS